MSGKLGPEFLSCFEGCGRGWGGVGGGGEV